MGRCRIGTISYLRAHAAHTEHEAIGLEVGMPAVSGTEDLVFESACRPRRWMKKIWQRSDVEECHALPKKQNKTFFSFFILFQQTGVIWAKEGRTTMTMGFNKELGIVKC